MILDKDIACDGTKCKCVWYSDEYFEQIEYDNILKKMKRVFHNI